MRWLANYTTKDLSGGRFRCSSLDINIDIVVIYMSSGGKGTLKVRV